MKRTSANEPGRARRPRGRPREFDRDRALDAAMEVFWNKGFEAASLAELTVAMGINPPSLYAAFGDKESLFLEAIERYQKHGRDSCPYADEPTARGATEKLLVYAANEFTNPRHPKGCLMMMAAATSSTSSKRLQEKLAGKRAEARGLIKARLERGIAEGELPPETDAASLAMFYSSVLAGMAMQARDGASRRTLLMTVEAAMRAWPKARAKREAAAA
ncbi:MAG: TetR/AcrR family transcriptional regulator [Bacillota bacterium]